MKNTLIITAVLTVLVSLTSCKKCETCTGVAESSVDGVVIQTSQIPAQEYCDEALDITKAGSSVTQTTGGITATVKTTYTCTK